MNQDLIRQWLDLPTGNWPPDHYTLLALPPKEANADLIERRIHQRMIEVRPYQLNFPEEVTDVLNRLAAAFNCLTDPAAKQAYDASFGAREGEAPAEPLTRTGSAGYAGVPATPSHDWAGIDSADPLAWLFGPWSRLTVQESRNRSGTTAVPTGGPAGGDSIVPDSDRKHTPNQLTDRKESDNPVIFRVGKIWSWLMHHPGIPLFMAGLLAFLLALIRHMSR
jgi:hypothetical protein